MMKTYRILLPLPFDEGFDYRAPEEIPSLTKGQLVTVPFQGREKLGIVWEEDVTSHLPQEKIKTITSVLDIKIPLPLCSLIAWVSAYYVAPLGAVFKMVIPQASSLTKKREEKKEIPSYNPQNIFENAPALSKEQKAIAEALSNSVQKGAFTVNLVEGVTGSGKTEVYTEAIATALAHKKSVLVLLPEIALSHQWQERFEKRFGVTPHVWHSNTPPSRKAKTWQKALQGDPLVVVGARSSVFIPFASLGLIIVDEEHDTSYKQESNVMYHARDMAILRAQKEKIPVILSTATPSLETLYNVQKGKYKHFHLPERYGSHPLPHVTIIDLSKEPKSALPISKPLEDAIQKRLTHHQQVFLFLNRRGYAPIVLCPHCGHKETCKDCAISLVFHQKSQTLECHHCGHRKPFPKACETCHTPESLLPLGLGVERIVEEAHIKFPHAKIGLFTSETMENPEEASRLLEAVADKKIDILVGTQILTKGHHFPHLNLVAVIMGDLDFYESDLRATEKTHQLLHQVAGRAGREKEQGEIIIQTYTPKNPLLEALASHDPHRFYALELESRASFCLPPFGRLASLIISATNEEVGQKALLQLKKTRPHEASIHILGPAPAPLYKLRKWYRWRFLIKTDKAHLLQSFIRAWIKNTPLSPQIKLQIDMDPVSFM